MSWQAALIERLSPREGLPSIGCGNVLDERRIPLTIKDKAQGADLTGPVVALAQASIAIRQRGWLAKHASR